MKVLKIVQRAALDSRRFPVWSGLREAGGGAGRAQGGAEPLQRVVLMEAACVVLSGPRCAGGPEVLWMFHDKFTAGDVRSVAPVRLIYINVPTKVEKKRIQISSRKVNQEE